MLESLADLYVEHASARKIKYDRIISDFADNKSRPSMHSNRLLRVVRSTGASVGVSWRHLRTVQLHKELNKYAMGV